MAGSKKTKSAKAVVAFANLKPVTRTRGGSSKSDGGRYSVKTRRLTVPASLAGKSVAVSVGDGVLVVGGTGDYKVHSSQHFVTLPAGTVAASENVTLATTTVEGLPKGAVAYRLP